jgi:hypothetical protein
MVLPMSIIFLLILAAPIALILVGALASNTDAMASLAVSLGNVPWNMDAVYIVAAAFFSVAGAAWLQTIRWFFGQNRI